MKQTRTPQEQTDNLPLAVSVVLFTVLGLSLGDALVKMTSSDFVIWQIFVVRSLIAIPCLILFMATVARHSLRLPVVLGWTVLRSALLTLMWVSYYISLPHLTLSVAAAAYYTLPIFITLFSAFFVGESISRKGWFAIVIGFAGVCLILRPKAGDFNWFAMLPLLAAMLYAVAMILTRTKCRAEHPLILSLALNISFIVIGCVAAAAISMLPEDTRHGFLLAPWTQLSGAQWISMCLLAVAILIGSIGAAIAYQNGPSSIIGTFDFAYVGFAVLWGVIFFGEIPDTISVVGIALIVMAGILSLSRKSKA